jgi:hypothetical protein
MQASRWFLVRVDASTPEELSIDATGVLVAIEDELSESESAIVARLSEAPGLLLMYPPDPVPREIVSLVAEVQEVAG